MAPIPDSGCVGRNGLPGAIERRPLTRYCHPDERSEEGSAAAPRELSRRCSVIGVISALAPMWKNKRKVERNKDRDVISISEVYAVEGLKQ